jgi:hypothetical protein
LAIAAGDEFATTHSVGEPNGVSEHRACSAVFTHIIDSATRPERPSFELFLKSEEDFQGFYTHFVIVRGAFAQCLSHAMEVTGVTLEEEKVLNQVRYLGRQVDCGNKPNEAGECILNAAL